MTHTILLLQRSDSKDTRTYENYDSSEEALEGIIRMFEARLKALCPTSLHVNYSLDDLNRYIDKHNECHILVLDTGSGLYTSHDTAWIKDSIHKHLQKLSQKTQTEHK